MMDATLAQSLIKPLPSSLCVDQAIRLQAIVERVAHAPASKWHLDLAIRYHRLASTSFRYPAASGMGFAAGQVDSVSQDTESTSRDPAALVTADQGGASQKGPSIPEVSGAPPARQRSRRKLVTTRSTVAALDVALLALERAAVLLSDRPLEILVPADDARRELASLRPALEHTVYSRLNTFLSNVAAARHEIESTSADFNRAVNEASKFRALLKASKVEERQ